MPTPDPQDRAKVRRDRLVTAAVALGLAGGLALVWALGGFGFRQDLFTKATPGTSLDTGPYALTLTTATVQHVTSKDRYTVVVRARGRTTGQRTITPTTGDDGFLFAQDRATREVRPADAFTFDNGSDFLLRRDSFTPGLPDVDLTVSFAFAAAPRGTVRVVVYQQEYTAPYVFGDELAWRTTKQAYDLDVPVTPLPDTEY